MSKHRTPWDDTELELLKQIRSELPGAKLQQISEAFSARNYQSRTRNAVKAKMKGLGLLVEKGVDQIIMPPPSARQSSKGRYLWSVPELGIFIPLHPLIADARQHAALFLPSGHVVDVFSTPEWPLALGGADVSWIRCMEEDRLVLRNYLDYLRHRASDNGVQSDGGATLADFTQVFSSMV